MSASWSMNFSSKIETTALVEAKVNSDALKGFRLNFDYLKNNIETIGKSVSQSNSNLGTSTLDPNTLNRNWFSSSYIGPFNPKNYQGKRYDKVGAEGITGVIFDTRTIYADLDLFKESVGISSSQYFDLKTRYQTLGSSLLIIPTLPKIIMYYSFPSYHPIQIMGNPR